MTVLAAVSVISAVYGAVVVALRWAVVEVRGPSMAPTLTAGDRLLTLPARRGWLRTGQVVVVADPADPFHLVVKRLTRTVGDRVEVRGDDPVRSTDSRHWGSLPAGAVRRIAISRWPRVHQRLTARP